jgi:hypothetical protein
LRVAARRRVDEIACLGGVVGFDVSITGCLSTRRVVLPGNGAARRWVVAGNHDLFAIRKLPTSTVASTSPPTGGSISGAQTPGAEPMWLFENKERRRCCRQGPSYLASCLSLAVGWTV